MRIPPILLLIAVLPLVHACSTISSPIASTPAKDASAAADEVQAAEIRFARTMADRDFAGFRRHLSSDAVFFDGERVLHGPAEIAAAWKPLFDGPNPPFSWAPDHVEALASADLALSTGPVTANGRTVGRFNSIWRLEAPHTWRIVFDKGEPVCKSEPASR